MSTVPESGAERGVPRPPDLGLAGMLIDLLREALGAQRANRLAVSLLQHRFDTTDRDVQAVLAALDGATIEDLAGLTHAERRVLP